MDIETETITIEDAEQLVAAALHSVDVSSINAKSVAKALVAAQAEGQAGHGFSRLGDYAAQVRSGKVDGTAKPQVQKTGEASLLIDAANGFAYPALDLAIKQGAALANKQGCASVAITQSHHCGALSVQVARIAEKGLVGLMVANSPPAIAPWGSHVPVFGTNPIAFSAPRQTGDPLVIDLSLSRVARGKVMHAKKSGQPIPEGWALDASGAPTTDPDAALAGSMIAIGGAKGAALALIVEILAAAVPGAQFSKDVGSFFTADGPPSGAGQFLLMLRPPDLKSFVARIEHILTYIAQLDGTRLPGMRRALALKVAQAEGIAVPKHYLDGARAMLTTAQ